MPFQNELIILLSVSVMLSMGLSIKPAQLRQAARGRPFLYAMLINFVCLPAVAVLLSAFADAGLANAFLILAISGVGATASLFTDNVKGDIATATTAVVATGFVSLASLPIFLWAFGIEATGKSVAAEAFSLMLLWQIAPLLVGMWIHAQWLASALRAALVCKWLGNIVLVVLIVGLGVGKGGAFLELPLLHIATLGVLVLMTYLLPALIFSHSRSALVFTTSTRNINLSLLIAVNVLADDTLLVYMLVYSAIMYLLWPLVTWRLRQLA